MAARAVAAGQPFIISSSSLHWQPIIGFGLLTSVFSWLLVAIVPTIEALLLSTIILGATVAVVTTSASPLSFFFKYMVCHHGLPRLGIGTCSVAWRRAVDGAPVLRQALRRSPT